MDGTKTILAAASRLLQEAEASRHRQHATRLREIASTIRGALHVAIEADEKAKKPARKKRPILVMGDEDYEWRPSR